MASTFDRSLPSSRFDKVGNGKSVWDTNRSIWQDNAASGEPTRPTAIRQNSSTGRFTKSSHGSALTTIENPRNITNDTGAIWGSANTGRQTSTFASPTKSKGNGWPFDSKNSDLENSASLLAGSAPEFEPFGKENLHNNGGAMRGSDDGMTFDTHFPSSLRPSQLTAPHRALNSGSASTLMSNYSGNAQLHGLGMDTSPTAGRGSSRPTVNAISPTASRFARKANGYLDRTAGVSDEFMNAFKGMDLSKKSGAFGSYQFVPVDIDRGVHVVQDDLPPGRSAGYYEGGYQYEAAGYDQEYAVEQPQQWVQGYNGVDGRSRLDYLVDQRNSNNSGYYSASLTPTSGTESRHESGATSRTSQHDIALAGRKPGSGDSYATYVNNGMLVPLDMVRGYGLQMNPLAPGYHYYGLPGHFVPNQEFRPLPVRSALLEEFRLHRTTKRYELRDIFDHIVEFSGDQHGSRFIQQKLETANSDDKEQVFKEIQSNSLQLMTDLFGNYVIQKLFEHGSQSQKRVLADSMRGHVATLSLQMYGCRVVQKALEYVLTDQQASIVQELDGPQKNIVKVIKDQNGNHVVQKAIERVPAEHIQFIVEAHRGDVVKLAQHTYGCRVIQRILEYCTPAAKRIILDEVLACLPPLITDAFGNYVVQHVIQKGEPSDRRRVVDTVLQQLLVYSKHKFASNVVEMCLQHADEDHRNRMVAQLVGLDGQTGQSAVLGLLRDQYGNYVIQKVYALLTGVQKAQLEAEMHGCFMQLKRTSYGKQVVAIEKLLYGGSASLALPAPPQQPQQQALQPPQNTQMSARRPPPPIQFGSQPPVQPRQYNNYHGQRQAPQYYVGSPNGTVSR